MGLRAHVCSYLCDVCDIRSFLIDWISKNGDRSVMREENASIWVSQKLLVYWGSEWWFPDLDNVLYVWRWGFTHQRFLIPYFHNSCSEFQFEGRTNDTWLQINKYNEFIYSYICVHRIYKTTLIDACTQTHLQLVFLLLMKSDMQSFHVFFLSSSLPLYYCHFLSPLRLSNCQNPHWFPLNSTETCSVWIRMSVCLYRPNLVSHVSMI